MGRTLISLLVLVLAACSPPSSSSSSSASPAPEEDLSALQAKVAALPAPYNGASYEAGRRVFAQCRSCHTVDASNTNRVGPHLHGLIGRRAGSVEGFAYSPAVTAAGFDWDATHLDAWLKDPASYIRGNRMGFAGVRDDAQRRDLIAYLAVASQAP